MEAEKSTAKEFLQQVRRCDIHINSLLEERAQMEALAAKEYDIVLVNIVADVIIGLAPVLPNFLTEKSTLICSGILDTRLQDVLDALKAAGLTVTKIMEQEDWRCVTACRKF